MNKSKVRTIEYMVKIMVVVVHLRRGKLSLVHDILGRKRANIEALGKRTFKVQCV